MDTWANMEWHYEVHHRYGEQLVYYLLRVRPFEGELVSDDLSKLIAREELQSVRVFKIIGPNDLLIRAWHHSNVTPHFPEWLRETMVYGTEIKPFVVTSAYVISSMSPQVQRPVGSDILDNLYDEESIRAVQNGHDPGLLKRLLDLKMVFPRDQEGPDPIKFFMAMSLSQKEESIQADAAKELCTHILQDMPTIKKVSVYRGYGFCDIFLKAEVEGNLFSIGELIDWVYSNLKKYGANTETYICAWPSPLVETPDKVSEATFKAIQGKDLFVQSVIPELYDRFYSRRKEIEPPLLGASKQVIVSHRKLVHDYLLGFLEGKMTDIGRVLFTFFTELEEYLRENHREFIGRNKLTPAIVYDAVGVSQESRKHIGLGELFNIHAYVLKESRSPTYDSSETTELHGEWNALAKLRNKSLHGDLNYKEEWQHTLLTLLDYLPRVERLVELVASYTGNRYGFTYLLVHDPGE